MFFVSRKRYISATFLAREVITILLFFAIPEETRNANEEIEGVLLFIILTTCLIMSWRWLFKKQRKLQEILNQVKNESVDKDTELVEEPAVQKETENNIE